MNFSSILPSLQGNVVDMGISTITATEERSADYAFSDPYFFEELHLISRAKKPLDGYEDLRGRRIACQLGSTMEIWMRRAAPSSAHMVLVDSNVQAIEALKAGLVDGIVVDSFQAKAFCERNAALKHIFLDRSGSGYAVAMRKNSPYLEAVNNTIKDLRESGDLENLCKKWGLQ
jgi:polar amino acid transport system substrate-binding protein